MLNNSAQHTTSCEQQATLVSRYSTCQQAPAGCTKIDIMTRSSHGGETFIAMSTGFVMQFGTSSSPRSTAVSLFLKTYAGCDCKAGGDESRCGAHMGLSNLRQRLLSPYFRRKC